MPEIRFNDLTMFYEKIGVGEPIVFLHSAADWRLYPQLSHEQLRTIGCPSLFIAGQDDPFATREQLQLLCTLVADSRYLVVPEGGHRPHMISGNAPYVNREVLRFLAEHPMYYK